jgi:hypothetical protein
MVLLQVMLILSNCAASLPAPATLLRCVAFAASRLPPRRAKKGRWQPTDPIRVVGFDFRIVGLKGRLLLLPLSPTFAVARYQIAQWSY